MRHDRDRRPSALRRALGLRAAGLGSAGLAVVGLALAGCGSSGKPNVALPPSHFLQAKRVSARVRGQERALRQEVLAGLRSPAPRQAPGVAAFIPKATTQVGRIVTATRSDPQLAIAGSAVVLDLASGHALATMNGPLYNNRYVGTNDPTVPAKFLLTFTRAHGTLPLAPDDFTILDERGNNIVPRIQVRGGGPLPKELKAGQRLTLLMSTIIAAGDGSIVYNPTGITKAGHTPLVGWDFIVEDD